MADEDMVTISREEYEELLQDQRVLRALEGSGVDNWEWYEEAMSTLEEDD